MLQAPNKKHGDPVARQHLGPRPRRKLRGQVVFRTSTPVALWWRIEFTLRGVEPADSGTLGVSAFGSIGPPPPGLTPHSPWDGRAGGLSRTSDGVVPVWGSARTPEQAGALRAWDLPGRGRGPKRDSAASNGSLRCNQATIPGHSCRAWPDLAWSGGGNQHQHPEGVASTSRADRAQTRPKHAAKYPQSHSVWGRLEPASEGER